MSKQTKNKVPTIRFKDFTEEWEEKTFGENFTNLPNNTLSLAELNYDSGLAKNIHYGDVLIKFGVLLDIEKDDVPFVSNNELGNKLKAAKLQNGDIIIADAAEDTTVGKCTEVMNIGEEVVLSGLHTIAVRPTASFAPAYLGYFMNSPSYHDQLLRLMQGTKVLSISKSAIKDTAIRSPNKETEQQQIGIYFQETDQMIGLHQRKHEKLVTLKKAMLSRVICP